VSVLRFRDNFRVEVIDNKLLFLLNDEQAMIVENPNTARVATLIDGQRTTADVMSALAGQMAPDRVFLELAKLQKSGHVVTTPSDGSLAAQYVEGFGRASDGFATRTAPFEVAVLSLTSVDLCTPLTSALASYAPRIAVRSVEGVFDAVGSDLVVVVVDDYLSSALREINKHFKGEGQPWVLVKPAGREVWVGPRFIPGETGCWESVEDRIAANRQVERYVAGKTGAAFPQVKPAGLAPGATGIAAGVIANEILALAAGLAGELAGAMRSLDVKTYETRSHTLIDQPQFSVEDPASLRRTSEVTLTETPAQHLEDGGYRVCTPRETYDRLERHISHILGAVSRLTPLDADEEGITYSFAAGHNFGMMGDNMDLLRSNMRGQSGGKGRTEIQAKVSGICEALERYSGVWTPDIPEAFSTWNALEGRKLHPGDYLRFSDEQYAIRESWNADPRNRLQKIPHRFDHDKPIHFTAGRSLTTGEEVMIPSAMIWFGHPDLKDMSHLFTMTDSNGGAAGNTMDEAVLQGLCEVYERDAVALWWFNRIARPGIDLDSVKDPYVDQMREFYASMDRNIWVIDLSNDLGISTFAAFSRRDHEVEDIMVGFGAHPDPHIAFFRALTELNQFLPFVRKRDAEGNTIYQVDDAATLEWCKTRTCASEPWILPDPAVPLRTLEELEREIPTTLGGIVQYCVDDLAAAGMETIVVNQTRPDIDLAVAKVFVPGMRHFWRRTGPGRIYDIPVQLGWREAPIAEADVNPIGVFF